MSKLDLGFQSIEASEEASTLYNNGKVLEVFSLAETGAYATIETAQGEMFVVCKVERFKELMEKVAGESETKVEFNI